MDLDFDQDQQSLEYYSQDTSVLIPNTHFNPPYLAEEIDDVFNWHSEDSSEVLGSSNSLSSDSNFFHSGSSPTDDGSLSQDSSRKPGRKTRQDTLLFHSFKNIRQPYSNLKKEYLRIKMIRGFKRAIRQVRSKTLPRTKIHGFQKGDQKALIHWQAFCKAVRRYSELADLAPTTNGPGTDGKAFRRSSEESEHRCFTDAFCRGFFESEIVRNAYRLYLNLVFCVFDDEEMKKKFEFSPIAETDEERYGLWERLREYLYRDMFRDLGLEGGGEIRG